MIIPKGEVHATEAKALFIGKVYVNRHGVFALILRVLRREEQVLVTVNRGGQIGQRIGVENSQAVGTSGRSRGDGAGRGDDVARERQAGLGVHDHDGLVVEDVVRVEEFTEVAA